MNFAQLGVKDVIIQALKENEISRPTEIQEQVIPFLIAKGTDLVAQAQTGTGKTIAFGLPLIQRIDLEQNHIQAVILVPTRELGLQISKQIFKYTKYLPKKLFVETVYGGERIEIQISNLKRPTHILVATPGRLIDLLKREALNINKIRTIVLDEADEMLSLGFKDDINSILEQTNGFRNTWLFSATMPDEIKKIINVYLSPKALTLSTNKNRVVNQNIEHQFVVCDADNKFKILMHFLKSQKENRGIIFCRTKATAQGLTEQLKEKNISVDAIHGDLKQIEREKVMRAFKNKKLQILVATDLSARGIDVENLAYVAHYQLPEHNEYYTHRSGRTARAGKKGISICFISPNQLKNIEAMEKALKISFKKIK